MICKVLISSSNHSEKTAYTVRRLQIGEKAFFYIQTAYNAFMLSILFFVQILLLFIMCKYYIYKVPSDLVSDMSLFFAFYRVDFLHSILPLDEVIMTLGNVALIIGLSFSISSFSFKSRRGKFGFSVIILLAVVLITFQRSLGSSFNITLHVAGSIAAAKAIWTIHRYTEEKYEKIN